MKYCKRTEWMTPEEQEQLANSAEFSVCIDSIRRMNDDLIDAINRDVGEDDVLWTLGDLCFASKKFYYDTVRELRNRMKCKNVHTVWGNHDHRCIADLFSSCHEQVMISIAKDGRYWIGEDVIGDRDSRDGRDAWKGQKIILNHYPMLVWNGSHKGNWMLHGHCHTSMNKWISSHMPNARILDVGVDGHDYRPWAFDEIKLFMQNRSGCAVDHHKV